MVERILEERSSDANSAIKYRHIFAQYANFNRMQSEVIDMVFYSDKSIVVSAPTGSGKTVILELAIIRLLIQLEEVEYKDDFKIIYMAPIKALCNEITADWQSKFGPLGVLCGSVTGDDGDFDFNTSKFNIIITTPEKWDSLSRKWNICEYMKAIKLLMIDEVHLLNEDKRGPILEAVVSRMKTIRMKLNQQYGLADKIRFLAVSATIPNIADLASWLDHKDNIVYHKVSEDLRPVKLERHVLGYSYSNIRPFTPFRFDMNLTYKLPAIIERYSNNKPALVFCNSRKSAEMGATTIIDKIRLNLSDEQRQKISAMSSKIEENKLRTTISKGVAYHHAGLCVSDKKLVEEYFRSGLIPILFSTNTLAMGVNLPAYLVVIKSTEMLVSGTVHELSEAVILQMIGRAGRPQFDDHGVAVIMTQINKVKKYENLLTGTAPIESHLHNHLIEHLNSEIVSQTISNIDLVIHWIRSSYLYIRAIKNPLHYGLPTDAKVSFIEKKLEELCINAIDELEKYGLVVKTNSSMKSTQLGRLMAHYYLNFETMKHFTKITGTETVYEIFNILISCPDFVNGYHLRVNDKRVLNELNKGSKDNDPIRYPIKGKVKTVTDKISCLMQATLGNIVIGDPSLTEEASQLIKLGQRIGRALQEYVTILDSKNNYSAIISSNLLLKSLHVNLWENSSYIFKQFKKIGHVYSKVLSSMGKTSFESISNSIPSDVELILKKRPPFGKEFLDAVSVLPQYTIDMERKDGEMHVVARQVNKKFVCDPRSRGVTLIVGDNTNEMLFHNSSAQYFLIKYGHFERTIPLKNSSASRITAHLIHNGIVGLDKYASINLQEDDQSVAEPTIEPEPKPAKASKRKAPEGKNRGKQLKISEYMTSPKKTPQKRGKKTDGNKVVYPKKAKYTENDSELDKMQRNEVIDLCAQEETAPKESNVANIETVSVTKNTQSQTVTNDAMNMDKAVQLIQSFKKPEKRVFTFIRPRIPTKDILSDSVLEDISAFDDPICETSRNEEDYSNSEKDKFKFIAPRNAENCVEQNVLDDNVDKVSHEKQDVSVAAPTNVIIKPPIFIQPKVSSVNTVNFNNVKSPTKSININKTENSIATTVTEVEVIKNCNQKAFVPTCIKATFGEKSLPKPIEGLFVKEDRRRKDIKFRYDHLLTPIEHMEITSDSQTNSVCDVIEEQQKLHIVPMTIENPPFPFHNFYIKNFCAAKELQRIDRASRENDDVDEIIEKPLFSLDKNGNNSSSSNSINQSFVEPVKVKEQPMQIERIETPTVTSNPMALNEHKYSKWNSYAKKIQTPVPSQTCESSNVLSLLNTTGLSSSQAINSTQQFHKSLDKNLNKFPMLHTIRSQLSTNPFINFDLSNSSDAWFQPSQLSQQASANFLSGYESSYPLASFVPSQSFNW